MSLKEIIDLGENRKIEFKEILPSGNGLSNTVVAFSNGAGGKLIIGISDEKEIIGITDEEIIELPDKISNIIYDSCYPAILPEIYIKNIDGKKLLIINIFPGNLKPYFIKAKGKLKGTYIRVGATNKIADEEMIQELERQKRNISFDEEIMYDYDINNIDFDKLIADFGKYIDRPILKKDLINLKLIKIENQVEYPTRAAALLADKYNYHEFARIKCARFKGNDIGEFIDQKEFNGSLYEQLEDAMKFAKTYVAKNGRIYDLQRIDEYEIPLVAIREAIVNAIVHRDYSISGADIKFAIFDDRIEITTPGFLPKTLDIEEIKDGRSEIRNKVIARVFKEIRFIEEWGTGIKRIFDTCKKAGLRQPEIIESGMFLKVIIYKSKNEVNFSSEEVANSGGLVKESSGKVMDSSGLNDKSIRLSDNERVIMMHLYNNSSITNREAKELTGLSPSGVRKIFVSLKDKGLIVSQGEGRSRSYCLQSR